MSYYKNRIPASFENKLLRMLCEDCKSVLNWNEKGDGFIIYDVEKFITQIIPNHFRIKTFLNFIKKLKSMGFVVSTILNENDNFFEFKHPQFTKDPKSPKNIYDNEKENETEKEDILLRQNYFLKRRISEINDQIEQLSKKCKLLEEKLDTSTVEPTCFHSFQDDYFTLNDDFFQLDDDFIDLSYVPV